LFAKIFSSSKHLENIKRKERKISKELLFEIKTPVRELFSGRILNEKGEEKIKKIFEDYIRYGKIVDIAGFLFQLYLTDEIKKEIFKKLKKPNEEKNRIFNLLLSSYRKTNYEKFLFALSKNLNNEKKFDKIAKKFYWLVHDYLGEIVDVDYIKNKVKEFKKNPKELLNHLFWAIKRIKEIKMVKKELPPDLLKKINIIQEILYLYNERKKEVLNQVNIYLRKIFEYRFPGISLAKIKIYYQLLPEEIIDLLKGKKIKEVEQRNKKWVYLIENEKIKSVEKKNFRKYFSLLSFQKETKILYGIPASPGKVIGRVNVVLNISHLPKFKKDEILVAPFTNVNYLPIMSKAKAILTETGGLTSHAAIVSRELKKPCIVGIKNLLVALKDGDLVEVDANKGIIKILKSQKKYQK
jgi:phosphohistidine swiveling domain-containing protein